jgi:hypothetical protein
MARVQGNAGFLARVNASADARSSAIFNVRHRTLK